ncbi:hypothetical protein LEP1GSC037_1377 [Leptospira interrogans str. 2006001854]|uniref:Uncharacterized protein n=1 Tax=Leptospira interrogans str. 2006001854 TaxID=1001590 RepID=M6G8L0_LEPIR|nr:hypothetical protein LEP1GSC037_1377 [Leptospira interrogans str. 2006001854]
MILIQGVESFFLSKNANGFSETDYFVCYKIIIYIDRSIIFSMKL